VDKHLLPIGLGKMIVQLLVKPEKGFPDDRCMTFSFVSGRFMLHPLEVKKFIAKNPTQKMEKMTVAPSGYFSLPLPPNKNSTKGDFPKKLFSCRMTPER